MPDDEYECSICGEKGARYWEGIDGDICEECKYRLLNEDIPSLWIFQMIKTGR